MEIPDELNTADFREAWADYHEHRKHLKASKFTPVAKKRALMKLARMGAERAIAALENSIANNWIGIHEPKPDESPAVALASWEPAWSTLLQAAKVWSRYDEQRCVEANAMLSPEIAEFAKRNGGLGQIASMDQVGIGVLQARFRKSFGGDPGNLKLFRA